MASKDTTKPDIMMLTSKTYSKRFPIAIMHCFALNAYNDVNETISFVSNAHKSVREYNQKLRGIDNSEVPYGVFDSLTTAPDRIEYADKVYWLDKVEKNYNGDTAYRAYYYYNITDNGGCLKVIYSSLDESYTVQYEALSNS